MKHTNRADKSIGMERYSYTDLRTTDGRWRSSRRQVVVEMHDQVRYREHRTGCVEEPGMRWRMEKG